MIGAVRRLVAFDAGESLVLAAAWSPAGQIAVRMEAGWPLRVRPEVLHAWGGSAAEAHARRWIAGECTGHGPTLLVPVGQTPLPAACETADLTGCCGVIVPAFGCALSTEGVTVATAVRDFARPVPPGGLDLVLLRDLFAEMMEEASEYVQQLQLDQDDSLLDRFVDLSYGGDPHGVTVPVESLTDPDRLLRPFHALCRASSGATVGRGPINVSTARTRCIISTVFPVPRSSPLSSTNLAPPPDWQEELLPEGHRYLCRRP